MSGEQFETPEKLVAGGCVLVGLSLFLPWLSADLPVLIVDGAPSTEVTGLDAPDGIVALALVVLASILAWARDWDGWNVAIVGLLGLGVAAIGGHYLDDPLAGASTGDPTTGASGGAVPPEMAQLVEPGAGLFLALVGGLLLVGGAVAGYRADDGAGGRTGEPAADHSGSREAPAAGPEPAADGAPAETTPAARSEVDATAGTAGAAESTPASTGEAVAAGFSPPDWTRPATLALVGLLGVAHLFPWVERVDGSAEVLGLVALLDLEFGGVVLLAVLVGTAAPQAVRPESRQAATGAVVLAVVYVFGVLATIGRFADDEGTVTFDGETVAAETVEPASTMYWVFLLSVAILVVACVARVSGRKRA